MGPLDMEGDVIFFFFTAKNAIPDPEEEGTRHFMVNIIEPQFNLHSEDANVRHSLLLNVDHSLFPKCRQEFFIGYYKWI